jgi:1-aminocyclopropane-1-carboxylate deaminase
MAGLICGLPTKTQVIGISVLKGGDFLTKEIKKLLPTGQKNWELFTNYHFGGYAKSTNELLSFIKSFQVCNNILLDSVYMAKLVWGVYNLMNRGYFRPGSRVLILHSGGLQGISQDA